MARLLSLLVALLYILLPLSCADMMVASESDIPMDLLPYSGSGQLDQMHFPYVLPTGENDALQRQLVFRFGRTGNMRSQPFLRFG
uniref:Uncharacterized protein n=1 Tax=Steinernema glaseri TaxID=37863 RepID=A0A1I7ZCM8_9BILA